jgi:hypothetical protein
MTHPTFWLWTLFLAGQFLSTLLRAAAVVNSTLSGINTYRHFFEVHLKLIVGRLFFASCGLLILQGDPELFWSLLNRILSLNLDHVPALNPYVSTGVAGLYGFAADSLMDKLSGLIPLLRREVPPTGGKS